MKGQAGVFRLLSCITQFKHCDVSRFRGFARSWWSGRSVSFQSWHKLSKSKSDRPTQSQFWSLKIHQTTFRNYIKFDISGFWGSNIVKCLVKLLRQLCNDTSSQNMASIPVFTVHAAWSKNEALTFWVSKSPTETKMKSLGFKFVLCPYFLCNTKTEDITWDLFVAGQSDVFLPPLHIWDVAFIHPRNKPKRSPRHGLTMVGWTDGQKAAQLRYQRTSALGYFIPRDGWKDPRSSFE